MPNWCNNSITIQGPADKILALWAAANAGDDESLLQALRPMPEALKETVADGGGGLNWYNWRVDNWGTKWDISCEGLELVTVGDGTAIISGWADSAWSPPIDAFRAYANENEDVYLEIRYFEPGMSFIGLWDSEGGDAYWEDVGSLLETTAEEDDVLIELLEHFNVWDWYEFDEDDAAEE